MLGIKDDLHHVRLAFFILTKSHEAQTDYPQIHYMVKDDLELLVLQNAGSEWCTWHMDCWDQTQGLVPAKRALHQLSYLQCLQTVELLRGTHRTLLTL